MFDHVGTWKKNNEGGPQIPETVCFVCTFAMRKRKSEWLFAYIGMLSRRPQGPQPLPPPTHSSHSFFFSIFQKNIFNIFMAYLEIDISWLANLFCFFCVFLAFSYCAIGN